jgi:hypothetical protein
VTPLITAPSAAPPAHIAEAAEPSLLRAHGRLMPGEAEASWFETARRARARAATLLSL